ncbi:MAG: HelD family protein [Lachnospiraceae bacterium]|jgi:DNA helicase-2/ATP-dependent DNA helicase PcrA
MSRGTEFLYAVTEKIKLKIDEIVGSLQETQQDIVDMNEYYWENYTEMDQYGYENFDNQQALLMQVNVRQDQQLQLRKLKKMMDSPFFGSIDFVYEGEEQAERFYIGVGNFSEKRGNVPLIFDWRAPVSSLFYDYDKGDASYEAPAGTMYGEILSKWQYKIRGGRMIYEFESDTKIDDDILKQELSGSSDTQLKSIIRTIQKEQNTIIRNTRDKILVIQGAAGSGKTSIALHRIAYLLYHDREHLKSSNILILSPNSVFSDYISHVLPELGEEPIQEISFDLFAYRELQGVVYDCEDRWDQIERQIADEDAKAEERYRWKQSREYVCAAEGFLAELEDRLVEFADVTYREMKMTAEEILEMFYFKFQEIPLLSRMDAVMEYHVDEYETLYGRDIPEEEKERIREKYRSLYVSTDLYEIYNWFLQDNGWPCLPDVPREKRRLRYEDVYPMLYLKYRLGSVNSHKRIRHLVIDEMQDYSYLQYVILESMFSCNMTILGDRAQTVDKHMQDVLTFLPRIFGKQVRCIQMNKSYRNTAEISAYAEKITGVTEIEYLERHGKEVEEIVCASAAEVQESIRKRIALDAEGYETAAVLVMTEREARDWYRRLAKEREDVFYVDRDSSSFRKGITVTTFYMAKGLEFDQVFVVGGRKESPLFGQFRYICATRALHELYVYDLKQIQNEMLRNGEEK